VTAVESWTKSKRGEKLEDSEGRAEECVCPLKDKGKDFYWFHQSRIEPSVSYREKSQCFNLVVALNLHMGFI